MPTTYYSEAALQRRSEKFAFAAAFPGRLASFRETEGKTIAAAAPHDEGWVLVFTDGTFIHAAPGAGSRDGLLAAILAAREALVPFHGQALDELDRRIEAEREAMRLARMEKVLGAVETNLPQIPELRSELRRVLDEAP